MITQVRKIKPTRRSVSGVYAFRDQGSIEFESTLERDFLIRLEFCTTVKEIIPQPCRIKYFDKQIGRHLSYTPDFLVIYEDMKPNQKASKHMLVEVKPEKEWKQNWRRWFPKWKAAYRYAITNSWSFRIYDENRIRDQFFINIRFLERYKRMIISAESTTKLLSDISKFEPCAIEDIALLGADNTLATIWHLIANNIVRCDMNLSLNCKSRIWIANNE